MNNVIVIFISGFLISTSFSFGQQDLKTRYEPEFVLPVRSSPDNRYVNACNVVGAKWSIDLNPFPHYGLTQQQSDMINNQIDSVNILIEKKYGTNWWEIFQQEVRAEQNTQDKARNLVFNQSYISKLDSTMKPDGDGITLLLIPREQFDVYKAVVIGYGSWNGKTALLTYYRLLVDIENKSVQIISDKIEPFEINNVE